MPDTNHETISLKELFRPLDHARENRQAEFIRDAGTKASLRAMCILAELSGIEQPEGAFVEDCIDYQRAVEQKKAAAEVLSGGPIEDLKDLEDYMKMNKGGLIGLLDTTFRFDGEDPRIAALSRATTEIAGVELYKVDESDNGDIVLPFGGRFWGIRIGEESGVSVLTSCYNNGPVSRMDYAVKLIHPDFHSEKDSLGRDFIQPHIIEFVPFEILAVNTSSGDMFLHKS